MIRHGSLFSGIGGFDAAADAAGMETRWQVEINPFANRVLAKHWPAVRRYGDIRAVSGAELEPVDVVTGGFPCTDVSVAGKRAGLGGQQSSLFFELIRVVREMREATGGSYPAWLVLENVPGLLSSQCGRDFAVVLGELAQLGALDIGWRILDSRYFGVPQRRRRVFLVADFRGRGAAEVLALGEGGSRHPAAGAGERAELAYCLAAGSGGHRLQHEQTYVPVTAFAWQQGDDSRHGRDGRGRSWVVRAGDYVGALSTTRHDAVAYGFDHRQDPVSLPEAVPMINQDRQAVYQCHGSNVGPLGALRQGNGGLTGGVPFVAATRTHGGHPHSQGPGRHQADDENLVIAADEEMVRRLTPTEAERLQAFGDGWTCLCGAEPYSIAACRCPDSARYAALGNAVTKAVATWILRRLATVAAGGAR